MNDKRWSIWQITAVLYPLGAGAAAVNLFFASLITSWWGWPVLDPWIAVIGGAILGIPATYYFARHIRNLMDKADKTGPS